MSDRRARRAFVRGVIGGHLVLALVAVSLVSPFAAELLALVLAAGALGWLLGRHRRDLDEELAAVRRYLAFRRGEP